MASVTTLPNIRTFEEFLDMEENEHYEWVNGCLWERQMSLESSRVGMRVGSELSKFADDSGTGIVCGADLGLQIFLDPTETRRADVLFISLERAPEADQGYLRVAPDLIVEVVSLSDRAVKAREKVDVWLNAGVAVVWMVYPGAREVHVYRRGAPPVIRTETDVITDDEAVPGFSCQVAHFFKRPRRRQELPTDAS